MNAVFREESLAGLVARAQADLAGSMGSRAAGAAFDVVLDPAITLDADRGALLQALANVFHNAVEASPPAAESKPIEVRAAYRRAKSLVELTVTDHGCGMDEETMAQLFVPFGSQKPGGTGVGMILVRKMIEEVHGGRAVAHQRAGTRHARDDAPSESASGGQGMSVHKASNT